MGFGAFIAVAWVQSLAGELRPHKLCSMVKIKKVSHKMLKTNKQTKNLPFMKTKICNIFSVASLCLEKAMATHSSTLAWNIPWTEEPGGLQSMGSERVGHD